MAKKRKYVPLLRWYRLFNRKSYYWKWSESEVNCLTFARITIQPNNWPKGRRRDFLGRREQPTNNQKKLVSSRIMRESWKDFVQRRTCERRKFLSLPKPSVPTREKVLKTWCYYWNMKFCPQKDSADRTVVMGLSLKPLQRYCDHYCRTTHSMIYSAPTITTSPINLANIYIWKW